MHEIKSQFIIIYDAMFMNFIIIIIENINTKYIVNDIFPVW